MSSEYHSCKSLIHKYSGGVEIPNLQRDYAQGRENRENIRNEFLDNLIDCINNENSILVLDFIYGICEKDKFIPLDGQQRLTTLFILHYYCLTKQATNELSARTILSYKTRHSSQKFCDSLMKNANLLERNGNFVEQIKDSSWFSNSWLKDPTIKGMLAVFHSIDSRIHNQDLKHYWSRLTQDECIKFLVKDLYEEKDYVASDNLYIKMNARGKLLSEFENFKSFIDGNVKEIGGDFYQSWIQKIDHNWTDLFWEYRNINDENPEDIDDEFMRFFKGVLYDKLILMGKDKFINSIPASLVNNNRIVDDTIKSFFNLYNKEEEIIIQGGKIYDELINNLSSDKIIYNQIYQKLNLFDGNLLKRISEILNGLDKKLKLILDTIKGINFNIESQKTANKLPFNRNIFQGIITGKVTYQNRLLFYTLVEILLRDVELIEAFQKLRVVRNLIENRQYNNVNDYRDGLLEITKIVSYDDTLKSLKDEKYIISHFEKAQITEERNKASVLTSDKGKSWESPIYAAENHDYLMGQINYLFKFAQVTDYDAPELENLKLFEKYYELSERVFKYNKENTKAYLLQRALLCFGDYLVEFSGRRKGLLTCNKERDTTFKKLLLHDNSIFFKKLLERLSPINNIEIEKDLSDIIDDLSSTVNDWRSNLIQNQYIIRNIGNYKLVEFADKENEVVFLITGSGNGWYFAELKTFDIYQKFINKLVRPIINNKYWELNYHPSTDRKIYPCLALHQKDSIDGVAIEIHFENFKLQGLKYRISVLCRSKQDSSVKQLLSSSFLEKLKDFEWTEKEDQKYYRYEKFYESETDCVNDFAFLIN